MIVAGIATVAELMKDAADAVGVQDRRVVLGREARRHLGDVEMRGPAVWVKGVGEVQTIVAVRPRTVIMPPARSSIVAPAGLSSSVVVVPPKVAITRLSSAPRRLPRMT